MLKEKNRSYAILFTFIMAVFAGFLVTSESLALPPTHTFYFDNNSEYPIYVWVTAASFVTVPGVTQLPSRVLVLSPHTTGNLDFAYTNVWDSRTLLALKFCEVNSESCTNTVGEFSAFSITPNPGSLTDWRVKEVWSGMVLPYFIRDNILQLQREKWNRDDNLSIKIVFQGKNGNGNG